MDPVSNLGQVLAILRRQMSERSGRLGPQSSARASQQPAGAGLDLADVQKKVQQRIRALDPGDERRHSKAVRIFLESVLHREFGDDVVNDPAFYGLVDEVQVAMESDPAVNAELGGLIRRLAEES